MFVVADLFATLALTDARHVIIGLAALVVPDMALVTLGNHALHASASDQN